MNYLMSLLDDGGKEPVSPFPSKGSLKEAPAKEMDYRPAVGDLLSKIILSNVKDNKPYQLSESAVKSGNNKENTCIGSICNVYKDLGVDFSGFGSESAGVRESRTGGKVVEYNPTFSKNYKKAGFEVVGGKQSTGEDLYNMIKNQELMPGDIIQYYDEKGVPYHSNVVAAKNDDGSYKIYNGYLHTNSDKYNGQSPIYNSNPEEYEKDPEAFKGAKFSIYRLDNKTAKKIAEKNKKK